MRGEPNGAAGLSAGELPLRAELFSVSQLEQHARALAGWREIDPSRGPDQLLPRLAGNEVSLRKAYALETEAVARGRRIPPAAEWFIDNYYLIEEQIRTARRHLPRGYSRELPRLANGPTAGMPRVYDIAIELISHSHGRVDRESLRAFVAAYQSVRPLRLGELWAIPIMLRLALLENLRRVVAGLTAGRADRERAGYWVERMLGIAVSEPAKVVLVLAEMVKQDPPLTDAFVTEFATRLQGQGSALLFPISWLEHRLAERSQTVEQVFQVISQTQAADQVAIGNSIGSLRFLGATDWRDFVEEMSAVERTLARDPARVYPSMDFITRDSYRHVVEDVARRGRLAEDEVARAAVELAGSAGGGRDGHVGHFLVGEGRERLERAVGMGRGPLLAARRVLGRSRLLVYGGAGALLTAGCTALLAYLAPTLALAAWMRAALLLLLAIASSQLAVAIVQWAATALVKPRLLPRLDFSRGIPSGQRTLVAVPTLLTDAAEIDGLLESLEVRHLANVDRELAFALVTDFRDAAHETLEGDAALLQRACDGIEALNLRHAAPGRPPPFHLLHRPRRWNEREGVWMGWERKRGKLEQLNAALRGDASGFCTIVGDLSHLGSVKYVIALDSDTQLPRDAARALAGAMAHPLNRPRFAEELGRIDQGYAILQPRVAITMASARRSRFAALHAGEPGIDPYTRAISDVYQDVFDEGSFVGKGIYDVDAFQKATAGRLPDDRVLSHDLLEGALARAGHLSDVLLFEDHPSSYAADVSRRSRWMRGDWQIAAWLGRRVPAGEGRGIENPLSWLSQWKILDNLRRSLQPIALVALLVIGWIVPGLSAFSSAVVAAILVLPALIAAAADLARRPAELPRSRHAGEVAGNLSLQLAREAFALACLPYEAYLSASAILTTAWRLLVTRRKLLEWRTAADAQRGARSHLAGAYRSMWVAPATAAAAMSALLTGQPGALPLASPVLALWALAPALAFWVSLPLSPERHHLQAGDVAFLRRVARRTWRFFETFVVAADNHLPPDNFQEDPPQGVAHRTSPTNIGLSLTANLAAYDFGYLSAGDLVERTALTLASLDKLQRHRTHFCNWYDTRTLEPLRPMYVSTVDSGNLAGHLLTLAAGLQQLAFDPVFRSRVFAGLADTVEMMAEGARASPGEASELARLGLELAAAPATISGARRLLERLAGEHERLGATLAGADAERISWVRAFEEQRRRALDELVKIAPWAELPAAPAEAGPLREAMARLDRGPTLLETAALEQTLAPEIDRALALAAAETAADALVPWLSRLRDAIRLAASRAAERLSGLRQLAARCGELADLDYEFLYDRDRHLLAIGYNVTDHRLDVSFYDLLASEARLASFVAIAQGKLPQEHWFSLGRLLTTATGKPALLSWSGSMFEYLMPLLVMPDFPGTILDQTCRGVVKRQIEFGRERGVPWGVSESGYCKTDAQLNYQYRAFGVPGLGFKRGLADDLVIAPYASALALMIDPEEACANLRRLAREGLLAAYGFYEAVDYTPARLPRGRESVTVRSYMAHHQGMTFLSLAHLLFDRPMQRRFDSDPSFRATELLLQERVPRTPPIDPHPAELSPQGAALAAAEQNLRAFSSPSTPAPQVQLLSNGSYHVAVTNAGGGYSRWRGLSVTRWHEDPTRDCWGSFCYLRDVDTGAFWSVAHQPSLKRAQSYQAIFSLGRAEFRRRDGEIDTHVEISVSPEDDVELRRISLTNRGSAARTIELTSFSEVVLAPAAADAAHPAFSNLFVQTELIRERQAILCTRRPRSGGETPPWMLHLMTVHGAQLGAPSYETRRDEFIGRGRSPEDPAAMHRTRLGDGQGAVLDPAVAIRNTVIIQPDETVRIHLVTGVAETRPGAMALVEKYGDRHSADRVFEMSWTHSQVLLRRLDATEADTLLYERLVSNVLYASATMRGPRSLLAKNRRGQSALWPYSISGDLPIALVRIADREHLGLVRQMVQAHAYWRLKGVAADLMIWNEDSSGYRQALQDEILAVIAAASEAGTLDKPGGIFIRRGDQMSEEDKILLQTVARLIVNDRDGTLAEQVNRRPLAEAPLPLFAGKRRRDDPVPAPKAAAPAERSDLAAFNGKGGFTHDGREYVITTGAEARTPAPWVNVMANPYFGTVVSESGGAYTWCENAHGYRLTPWRDDPVGDASGEAFYLRDQEDGRYWSPTPLPAPAAQPYTTRHGFGYSVFEHEGDGIATELQTFVATDAPLKFMVFKLRNRSGRTRRLSLTGVFELVLGEHRAVSAPQVISELDPGSRALFARNAWSSEFAARVAFLDCSEEQRWFSGDRLELIGRNGSLARPACMTRARLSGRVGAGLDPCLAMQVEIDLADDEEREIAFTFGSGRDLGDARTLVHRFRGTGPARNALADVWSYWNRTLGAVHVQTPDASLNFLANGWLLYQVLASRLWGRSGFYQSGGAFGFRDQLQDAMALVHAEPAVLREQIVRSAAHQFREGDVQHWWHPPLGRGVRTRISDDYLFLPSAVCRYVAAIGDTGVLEEQVRFLDGRLVKPDEDSYYDLPSRSEESATVYEHCVRAIRNGLRFGEHGLPLMGTGDWNDGMNLVGDEGKGESVWLAFFLYDVLVRFGALARDRQDAAFAELCAGEATRLRANIEAHAWDGEWYRRAYFDDGSPLGASSNPECQIDSLPQSWAVLSGAADKERALRALSSLDQRLVRRDLRLIQLFDPPFDTSALEPGYVKGYLPGVRENGGQYTHAAVWAVMAFAAAGDIARAWELFGLINPVSHGDDAQGIATYKVEPYVAAADVYTNAQHAGRGGWTWYTGSAAWMYRLAVESLLGLRLEVDRLRVEPLMPPSWKAFDVHYRHRNTVHHIHVTNLGGGGREVRRVVCDGAEQAQRTIPLRDDGVEHYAEVEIGAAGN